MTDTAATLSLDDLASDARARVAASASLAELEALKVEFFGKKGAITAQLKSLGAMAPDERKAAGARINTVRDEIGAVMEARKVELDRAELERKLAAGRIDVTQPGRGQQPGGLHPVTRTRRRIETLFRNAGFSIEDGPEVEDDWHNFEALNIPANHPARAMHDTFYLPDGRLLRTHTSPVQVRVMQREKPPMRVIVPGRVYRCDSDMTHTPMFHQVEGLVVDEGISFADLKARAARFPAAVLRARTSACASGRRTSRSPSRRPKSTSSASSAAARAAASASRRAGSRWSAAGWCIRTCCSMSASIRSATPASPSAWASSA